MSRLVFEILVIFLLLLANGMFAMSEIAIVSARKARLPQLAEEGHRGARAALKLAGDPNQFLATIQFGITLIGILTGAFGGATIAEGLGKRLSAVPYIAPYSHAMASGSSSSASPTFPSLSVSSCPNGSASGTLNELLQGWRLRCVC